MTGRFLGPVDSAFGDGQFIFEAAETPCSCGAVIRHVICRDAKSGDIETHVKDIRHQCGARFVWNDDRETLEEVSS